MHGSKLRSSFNFNVFMFLLVSIDLVRASYCEDIQRLYAPKNQTLEILGKYPTLSLHWGSDPSRAASAILQGVLRYALGFQKVALKSAPLALSELKKSRWRKPILQMTLRERYKEIIVVLSTTWKPATPECTIKSKFCWTGLAGHRLQEFGTSRIPTLQELYVHLPQRFQLKECANVILWTFYMHVNASVLELCGFGNNSLSVDQDVVTIYGGLSTSSVERAESEFQKKLIESLTACTESSQRSVQFKAIGRKRLLQMLQEENQSFLFIDYEMWSGYENVNVIHLPPSIPKADFTCEQSLDTAIAMRVTEKGLLMQIAPKLYKFIHEFSPFLDSIREILALETNNNIEEVACEWVYNHSTEVNALVQNYNKKTYKIAIAYCSDEPDSHEYDKVLTILSDELNTKIINANMYVFLNGFSTNCSNANDFKVKVAEENEKADAQLIGAVVGGIADMSDIIAYLTWAKLLTIIYDVDIDKKFSNFAWLTTGYSFHLALASKYFISSINCTHVAILSDSTEKAKDFLKDLVSIDGFKQRKYYIKHSLNLVDAEIVLRKLQIDNMGVILVNTNFEDAVTILSAASNLNMNATNNFTWIVRDWRRDENSLNIDIKHITLSSSCQCGKYISNSDDLQPFRDKINKKWPDCSWPTQAAVIADAVLTMVKSLESVVLKNPEIVPQTDAFIKLLDASVTQEPIKGVVHNLRFNERIVEEAAIFVNQWSGNERQYLAQWRVNATARTVHVEHESHNMKLQATPCKISKEPRTKNSAHYLIPYLLITFVLILVLTSIIIRFVNCNFSRDCESKQDNVIEMIQLSTLKIKRSTLKLYEKLDTGQFSTVRLGIHRIPEGTSRAVAVKEFFDEKEKSGMLLKARTLASLDHNHIIRLVGVFFEGGPSLIIMELAFFGNLYQYLRDRRYLVKGHAFEKMSLDGYCEAVHVSAKALTTLVRQAASALAYLSSRGVVHRDLRTSNCLVAADRSLKITGFDIAQNVHNIEDSSKNKSEKCKQISLHWLAPECLKGEFSTASDIWAFGVLVFEIVTLGALPYGNLDLAAVIQLLSAGGSPTLPKNTSLETYELTQLCWRSLPEERSTATEIEAYLADKPNAVSPEIP